MCRYNKQQIKDKKAVCVRLRTEECLFLRQVYHLESLEFWLGVSRGTYRRKTSPTDLTRLFPRLEGKHHRGSIPSNLFFLHLSPFTLQRSRMDTYPRYTYYYVGPTRPEAGPPTCIGRVVGTGCLVAFAKCSRASSDDMN